jgi:hypothetical protein
MCSTGQAALFGETTFYSREGRSTEASCHSECALCTVRTSRKAAAAATV